MIGPGVAVEANRVATVTGHKSGLKGMINDEHLAICKPVKFGIEEILVTSANISSQMGKGRYVLSGSTLS